MGEVGPGSATAGVAGDRPAASPAVWVLAIGGTLGSLLAMVNVVGLVFLSVVLPAPGLPLSAGRMLARAGVITVVLVASLLLLRRASRRGAPPLVGWIVGLVVGVVVNAVLSKVMSIAIGSPFS